MPRSWPRRNACHRLPRFLQRRWTRSSEGPTELASVQKWQSMGGGCGRVLARLHRVLEKHAGAAIEVELEHRLCGLVDVKVGDDELFLCQLGLAMDLAVGRHHHRSAILVLRLAQVAGGK